MVMIAYKSEVGAVVLAAAAVAAIPFVPRGFRLAAVPLWAALSRMVARGATNKARPADYKAPAEVQKQSPFVVRPDMEIKERPVAIVTGTNSGIGFFTAVQLALEGYLVVATCRSERVAGNTVSGIHKTAEKERRANPQKYKNVPETLFVIPGIIENDDFQSIRSFVGWFQRRFDGYNLVLLVNNAGAMQKALTFSRHNLQIETTTAVNFLGPMLLTELLLPLLEQHGGGRVVYVSSEAHRAGQAFVDKSGNNAANNGLRFSGSLQGRMLDAVQAVNNGKDGASGPLAGSSTIENFRRYGVSKLLGIYHMHHVARRYMNADPAKRVLACSLHPGCVVSNFSNKLLGGERSRRARLFRRLGLLFLKSSEEGAQTTLHCAMCPKEELELVYPTPAKGEEATKKAEEAVSRYFVECGSHTHRMLLPCGWDVEEGEKLVAWGKTLVGL